MGEYNMNLEYKIKEAVNFIIGKVWNTTCACNVSGGKDSTVLEDIVKRSGVNYNLYHGMTTIDPPELYKYVIKNYKNVIIARPKKSFWYYLNSGKGVVPSRKIRWCCAMLKHGPLDSISLEPIKIIGTRAEESTARNILPRVNFYQERNQTHIYPLLNWNEADIWEYIETYNLPYCELYDQGFDRTGCIVCPQRGEKQHSIYRNRYPGMFKAFEHAVKKLWFKRVSQGRTMFYNTPEEFLINWYKNSNSRWYSK